MHRGFSSHIFGGFSSHRDFSLHKGFSSQGGFPKYTCVFRIHFGSKKGLPEGHFGLLLAAMSGMPGHGRPVVLGPSSQAPLQIWKVILLGMLPWDFRRAPQGSRARVLAHLDLPPAPFALGLVWPLSDLAALAWQLNTIHLIFTYYYYFWGMVRGVGTRNLENRIRNRIFAIRSYIKYLGLKTV